jgi:hypothetical protein
VKAHSFTVTDVQTYKKDGGVFVTFEFTASDRDDGLNTILQELGQEAKKHGGLPSWSGIGSRNVWSVKGKPWTEVWSFNIHLWDCTKFEQDMGRFASSFLSVAFDGPDIRDEQLYELLRVSPANYSSAAPTECLSLLALWPNNVYNSTGPCACGNPPLVDSSVSSPNCGHRRT